jgi:hypothetical protein
MHYLHFKGYMIIGFDASTQTVGFAFYDGKNIVDAGFIDISKLETNKEKSYHVISVIETNPNISLVTEINLEAALSGFFKGKTSQQTIIKLARFNSVFEYIISEYWAIPVNLVNVTTARKAAFGKCRVKGISGKDYVRQELPKIHPEILKFEKINRKNEWDAKNADMYDAAVTAIFKQYDKT